MPQATNLRLLDLETPQQRRPKPCRWPRRSAFRTQNLIVGDRQGHIAWTIIGRIPQGNGAQRNDRGLRMARPRLNTPPSSTRRRGDCGRPTRLPPTMPDQQQVDRRTMRRCSAPSTIWARGRDRFGTTCGHCRPKRQAADMLAIQLDDRAVFLARWRQLLLKLLDESALGDQPRRAELKRLIANWEGRASVDSVALPAGARVSRSRRDGCVADDSAVARHLRIRLRRRRRVSSSHCGRW